MARNQYPNPRLDALVIKRDFPDTIKFDPSAGPAGLSFYYANGDGDRFWFPTWDEAAEDLAIEIDITDSERASVA